MTNAEFQLKMSQAGRPVIVDFWAPWCVPCRMTKPVLEKLAQQYTGRVDLWEISADENPELLRELKIYGIPTLIGYIQGKEILRHIGARPRNELESLFEALATGGLPTRSGPSPWERFLRLLAGSIVVGIGWVSHYNWFLLLAGGLVLFSAVYDRCPVWKVITAQSKKIAAK